MTRFTPVFLVVFLVACATTPPRNQDNACKLLAEKPGWYDAVSDATERWNVSEGSILAVIKQESSFISNAKPPRIKILRIFPGPRASSAYGYPQAKDGTWDDYKKSRGLWLAERDDFRDAADFVGWYIDRASRIANIEKSDVYNHYLAYHEGVGGFQRNTFQKKRWLIRVARNVAQTAKNFDAELAKCRNRLESGDWWNPFR